jgi:LmbE family N-acetylglucosaminyl deacetylase
MPERRTLLTVHAHPDDETISTGGVMARYSQAGHRVICVTCTGGEHGEIVVPELDTPDNHARLGEIRAEELKRALARLGPIESRTLGYVDSGMMGTPENAAAESFWQADPDEAAGRLVQIVRETQPDVIVGYNDFGGYGHPDHIRAALVAKLAFERAGDPAWYPEQLATGDRTPWQPKKLYETVMDLSRRSELAELLESRGVRTWMSSPEDETEEQRTERMGFFQRMVDASGPKTASVDIAGQIDEKLAALREHVTQLASDNFFLALTAEEWREHIPTEDFTLRVSYVPVRIPESDLFAGLT